MAASMKIRARIVDGSAHVAVLIMHPMETGQRKDPATGSVFPAHFIQSVTATVNERIVMEAQWGPAISRNPLLGFRVRGAKAGDRLVVSWEDNRGEKDRAEATIV